jgi:hypothetical protein
MKAWYHKAAGTALLSAVMISNAQGSEPWNKYALRLFGGGIENAGTIDSRDGYGKLDMGHEFTYGAGLTMALDRRYEFELTVSRWNSEGNQYNDTNPDDYIKCELTTTRFSLNARRKYYYPDLFVPWWGGGLDLAIVDTFDREVLQMDGGSYEKESQSKNYTGVGVHLGGGIDVYPSWFSGLAIFAEGRYTYYHVKSFNGDLNGLSLLIGLRWDFSQRGYYDKPWKVKEISR